MTMTDGDELQSWIGKTRQTHDVIALREAAGMTAMLDRDDPPEQGDPLPPGWHWIYFGDMARQSALGPDGHAARGEFLPPVQLPRRMWAGNRLKFHRPIAIGERVAKTDEILTITEKQGRAGALAFVTVKYSFSGDNGLALEEWHDIVYRAAAKPGEVAPAGETPPGDAAWRRVLTPDPVMLFRYSALTFNGHRIHYDHPYVTGQEGYPGLIVHGPLTASLLLDLIRREAPDAELATTTTRARRPLFADNPLVLEGKPTDGGCEVWAIDPDGYVAMTIVAEFK